MEGGVAVLDEDAVGHVGAVEMDGGLIDLDPDQQ